MVPSADAIRDVRERFDIGDRKYVIYPAITHPHKGHEVLIEMLSQLDTVLVLIGGQGTAEAGLRKKTDELGVSGRVIRPGRVSADDRDALVAGAETLVFPSRYEGFGAPLIEAMAFGIPVVCGDQTAIREVVADAALVVEDSSPEAWAAAVNEVDLQRDRLIAAGLERRKAFTQQVSGAALNAAYRQAVSR